MAAKCFPHGRLLEAREDTWRSILKWVQLVEKGLIWRIRDGEKVDAWTMAAERDYQIPFYTPRRKTQKKNRNGSIAPASASIDRRKTQLAR
jgi:hypothetical protein